MSSAPAADPSDPRDRGELGAGTLLSGGSGVARAPEPGSSHGELALCAHGLTAGYASEPAIEDVEVEIPYATTVALLGPNGSGKSSLFAAAVGLLPPWSGSIGIGDRGVALLPQQLDVVPSFPITARDVVEMGRWAAPGRGVGGWRRWVRRLDTTDRDRVEEAMAELGVSGLASRRFASLSGGQRQRVLLAQIWVQEAGLILLDEPHSGVDRPSAEIIDALIERWRERGSAVIVATHDLDSALHFERVLAINRTLIAYGPPGEVCTEPVLRETFSGHVARLGDAELIDTSHRHAGAG